MAIVVRGALVGRRNSNGGLVPNGSSISSLCSADPGRMGDLKTKQNADNRLDDGEPI